MVSVFVGWTQPVRAEDDDAMSESEISEIVDDIGGSTAGESTSSPTQTAAVETPTYEPSQRTHNDLEDDDAGVDQEVGQLGSQDALHESASSSHSSNSFSEPTPEPEYSTPIPEAKAEPWMIKEAKKQVKKAGKSKKSKLVKKGKKKSKMAMHKKKGKRSVASLKSKKKSKDRRLASRKTHRY